MSTDQINEAPQGATKPRHRMTTRQRLLFFFTAWLIVLMPFLFWWNTWFGRHLSDKQINEYLHDEKHPRHIQHALIQIGERIAKNEHGLDRWYPELVRLSTYPVEEVRNTDAWVMGQDNTASPFHEALLKMLHDPSLMVRGNAALSLVRFGDATGRPQIVALLQPARVTAPNAGKVMDTGKLAAAVHQGGLLMKIESAGQTSEIRSPITGRIRSLSVQSGHIVAERQEVAVIAPDTEQVWEALRALYVVGQLEDLPAVAAYERDLPDVPERVREQAVLTEKAIRKRAQ
jgi:biotin carboxyl carrier protein